ncbi:BRO-N domain-containing protein [Neisseria sp. Ec49-e6-T10]|uniref:BRO-N domain-containing protein n=1 Tax=Neisseria sp. Ec49-e6-T10 TaxID=3140744 RepID=UPI003EC07FFC
MSNLIPFSFEDHPVRTTLIDSEPWFVAVDVCKALNIKNARMAVSRLDEDEKMTVSNIDGHSEQKRGGAQSFNLISEAGLYRLIRRSNKPEAKRFDRWICHEVLPSIRKTGEFSNNEAVNIEGYNELKELNQLIGNILDFRFLLTFDEHKKPHMRILSYDDLILPVEHIPRMINNRMSLSEELLLKIMQACTKRLTMMASCRLIEEKIKK